MKILVVDDEPAMVEVLCYNLLQHGYTPYAAISGEECLEVAHRIKPDLIILDIMLPQIDGFEVCRQLRQESWTRVIILTARAEEEERIKGLELGAEDYIVKPFSMRELMARIKVVLQRSREVVTLSSSCLNFGDLVIDSARHKVIVRGKTVHLTPTEFNLLHILASQPEYVFSREKLLNCVWGDRTYGLKGIKESTLDVHIRRLREKIEIDPATPKYIITVKSFGLKFNMS